MLDGQKDQLPMHALEKGYRSGITFSECLGAIFTHGRAGMKT